MPITGNRNKYCPNPLNGASEEILQFPNKKFFQVTQVKGSCSSFSSRTLWILLIVPIEILDVQFVPLAGPVYLQFLNPSAPRACSPSSRTLFGPEPWASTCQEEMLPSVQMEKTVFL